MLEPDAQRDLAGSLFNQVWELLGRPERTDDLVDELIGCAHTSRHLWAGVGTPRHQAVGEWLLSRVYAELSHPESAVFHAERAVHWAEQAHEEPWVLASACEGMARAHLSAGRTREARVWAERSRALLHDVDDPEDVDVVARDLDGLAL